MSMKAKVLAPFVDKNTNELHHAGDVFECAAKRFKEINAAGFGNLVEQVEEEPEEKAEKADPEEPEEK